MEINSTNCGCAREAIVLLTDVRDGGSGRVSSRIGLNWTALICSRAADGLSWVRTHAHMREVASAWCRADGEAWVSGGTPSAFHGAAPPLALRHLVSTRVGHIRPIQLFRFAVLRARASVFASPIEQIQLEHWLNSARARIGEKQAELAETAGRQLQLEQAIAEAVVGPPEAARPG